MNVDMRLDLIVLDFFSFTKIIDLCVQKGAIRNVFQLKQVMSNKLLTN